MLHCPEDRYIDVNGVNTRYWDVGNSDSVIVLVHGIAASVEYFHANVQALSKKHRVIALDLIGFGKTDKPNVDYDTETFVNYLKDFCDALNLKKINLLGHSFGGAVAFSFSVHHPDYVERLILVSSAGFDKRISWGFRILTLPIANFLLNLATKKSLKRAIRRFAYKKSVVTDDFISVIYAIYKTSGARDPMLKIIRQHATLRGLRHDVMQMMQHRLPELKMPVLVVWGKEDQLLYPVGAHIAKSLIAHARIELFDHCGHLLPVECADELNSLVLDFLSEM